MPDNKPTGLDFASVISNASSPPDAATSGKDLPDGFPMLGGQHHRIVDTSNDPEAIEGVVAYDFKVHRRVFTIFRPWGDCARCANDIASKVTELPDEGDYECPHTMKEAYEQIVNEILAGHFLFGSEQEINQKDGSIVISLRWFEKKVNHKRRRQMEKEARASGGQKDEQPL